jgi:hypothetical protein
VAIIYHRGYAIEAEAVELELFEPIFAVREQEVENLVLAIIEAERVPCIVHATVAAVEILTGIAIEKAKALNLVLNSMRVYKIHNYSNTHSVSCIDKFFEVFGCSETRRCCKEA